MIRAFIGLLLLPSTLLSVSCAAQAVGLIAKSKASFPFLTGFAVAIVVGLFGYFFVTGGPAAWLGRQISRVYVFGHELTHALAAWSVGAKVLGFKVGEEGGHVDLSHSNAYIALAPYCLPIYTIFVVAGYRILLWQNPRAGGKEIFLGLLGLTLSFHLIKTVEVIWQRKQPDLVAAGGALFSLSWIGMANALVMLVLLKSLFPSTISLSGSMRSVADRSLSFWGGFYGVVQPIQDSVATKLKKSL